MFTIRSLLFAAAALPVQAQEAAEPNDTVATASAVACSSQVDGTLAAPGGDHDLWRLQLATESAVRIYTTSRGALPVDLGGTSAVDTRLDLYDSFGPGVNPPLASNDDHDGAPFELAGFFSKIATRLPAGTYYIDVYGFDPTFDHGDYALDVLCEAGPAPQFGPFCAQLAAATESEPNDDAATADPASCCRATTGSIDPGEEDWFALDLAADARCVFEVVADTAAARPIDDPEVLVYDGGGHVLLGADDDGGHGRFARLELELPAGRYVACVRHAFAVGRGAYVLRLDCGASDLPLPLRVPTRFRLEGSSAECVGTNGSPLTMQPRLNEWPLQHSVFTTDIAGIATVAVVLVGAFELAPAFDFAPGAPSCLLTVLPQIPVLPTIPTVAGQSEFAVRMAFQADVLGVPVYMQALSLDPGATSLGVTISDRLTLILGNDA